MMAIDEGNTIIQIHLVGDIFIQEIEALGIWVLASVSLKFSVALELQSH